MTHRFSVVARCSSRRVSWIIISIMSKITTSLWSRGTTLDKFWRWSFWYLDLWKSDNPLLFYNHFKFV